MKAPERRAKVVIVDNDRDIAELLQTVLIDEGYVVSCLYGGSPDAIKKTVARLEPDCLLLDGGLELTGYGESWAMAAWLTARERAVPVVMLTGHHKDAVEAHEGSSDRARSAGFAAVLEKPFDLDELLGSVRAATGRAAPAFGFTEAARMAAVTERLLAAGARDVQSSTERVGAKFVAPNGDAMQLYWWAAHGSYFVARYSSNGQRMEPLGQYDDLDAAIIHALEPSGS